MRHAVRHRDFVEAMLRRFSDMPSEQYHACRITLDKLNEAIGEFARLSHRFSGHDVPEHDALPEVKQAENNHY